MMSEQPYLKLVVGQDGVLAALSDARILDVEVDIDAGLYIFSEACDRYFDSALTKEQVLKLIDELKEMIDG